jgi:hypothetical protein
MMQDIRAELHFYGKQYDRLGMIYMAMPKIPMPHPDILFFCLITLRLMTDKKLTVAGLSRMRQRLAVGGEWEKVFLDEEQRPFDRIMELCEYSLLTKRVIRTQILFKGGDKYTFMLGYSGFGFWQSKRPFDRCAEGAVYGILEKIYTLKKDQPEEIALLWRAAQALSRVEFTVAGKGGYRDLAREIYNGVLSQDDK